MQAFDSPVGRAGFRRGLTITDPADALDRLYELLGDLRSRLGGARTLASCTGRMDWPARGVYLFFEPGEMRRDGTPRVVRVGTHALTVGSRTTLWQRLSQHRGYLSGRWAGGGNHRGSVFGSRSVPRWSGQWTR